MSNVVIFNGSPRYDGNSATILNMIERGAKEHNANVKWYSLFKMKMSACMGCFSCRLEENKGKCEIKDEMAKALEDVKKADAIVIGSPVYFMQINGMTKNLYDRMFPLLGTDGAPQYGTKKLVTVYSQESADPKMYESYFDYVGMIAAHTYGFVQEERIVCVNGNNPETADKNRELMNHAYELGRLLAKI